MDLANAVRDVPVIGEVIEVLKIAEGFEPYQYEIDNLPHIGYGTLLPLTKEEAEMLLVSRFTNMCDELSKTQILTKVKNQLALKIILHMMYQMGVPNLLDFDEMFNNLAIENYSGASKEMLDSLWAKRTPERAKKLATLMSSIRKG